MSFVRERKASGPRHQSARTAGPTHRIRQRAVRNAVLSSVNKRLLPDSVPCIVGYRLRQIGDGVKNCCFRLCVRSGPVYLIAAASHTVRRMENLCCGNGRAGCVGYRDAVERGYRFLAPMWKKMIPAPPPQVKEASSGLLGNVAGEVRARVQSVSVPPGSRCGRQTSKRRCRRRQIPRLRLELPTHGCGDSHYCSSRRLSLICCFVTD